MRPTGLQRFTEAITPGIQGLVGTAERAAENRRQEMLELSRRELEDRRTGEARTYATGERVAGQGFQTGERVAGQGFQTGERVAGQGFQTGERTAQNKYETQQESYRFGRDALMKLNAEGWTPDPAALEAAKTEAPPDIDPMVYARAKVAGQMGRAAHQKKIEDDAKAKENELRQRAGINALGIAASAGDPTGYKSAAGLIPGLAVGEPRFRPAGRGGGSRPPDFGPQFVAEMNRAEDRIRTRAMAEHRALDARMKPQQLAAVTADTMAQPVHTGGFLGFGGTTTPPVLQSPEVEAGIQAAHDAIDRDAEAAIAGVEPQLRARYAAIGHSFPAASMPANGIASQPLETAPADEIPPALVAPRRPGVMRIQELPAVTPRAAASPAASLADRLRALSPKAQSVAVAQARALGGTREAVLRALEEQEALATDQPKLY